MDIEARLRKLESRYRGALSAAVAAKAHYLALAGEPSATPAAIERAKSRWQQLESGKKAIAARMDEVERLEHNVLA
jgi:7-keto-8-aminopelargonate synthetase-like enzyme